MFGTLVGIGIGGAVFVGAWSAAGLEEGYVSTGAVTLGVLGAFSVAVLVSFLANASHQGPE